MLSSKQEQEREHSNQAMLSQQVRASKDSIAIRFGYDMRANPVGSQLNRVSYHAQHTWLATSCSFSRPLRFSCSYRSPPARIVLGQSESGFTPTSVLGSGSSSCRTMPMQLTAPTKQDKVSP